MTHKTRSLFYRNGLLTPPPNPLDWEIIMVLLCSTSWDGDHLHPRTSMKQLYVLVFLYEGTLLTLVLLALPMSLVASIDGILRIPKIGQRHSRALYKHSWEREKFYWFYYINSQTLQSPGYIRFFLGQCA